MRIYLCTPSLDIFKKAPFDWFHTIHKWSCGIILIDHIEPDGRKASWHHRKHIIMEM